MAVSYKLLQDKRAASPTRGKWFAHAINNGTVGINELVNIIQRGSPLRRATIVIVLLRLVDAMQEELGNSMRVKIDGLGSFKVGINSTYADSEADFSVETNVTGTHINFQPATRMGSDGARHKALLDGITLLKVSGTE